VAEMPPFFIFSTNPEIIMILQRYGKTTSSVLLKLLVLFVLASSSGCKGSAGLVHTPDNVSVSSRPKFIFLFIGDGMGPAQVKPEFPEKM